MTLCTDIRLVSWIWQRALHFDKLLVLTKTNVLCRSHDGKSSRVSLRHVGVPLSRMNTRIQSQCENEAIICDRSKSNETVSIHNVELYYTCMKSVTASCFFLGMCLTFLPEKALRNTSTTTGLIMSSASLYIFQICITPSFDWDKQAGDYPD